LFETGFAMNQVILEACSRHRFAPKVAARSAQIDFVVELVAAGLGVAFLPRLIAEQRAKPSVRRILLDEPGTEWRLVLAWRRGSLLSPAARAWLELAREAKDPNNS
jgi:DNA-binding transcriptional LysR family regulator